jgi:hypothetical protein
MSNYIKATNFTAKDALPSGNSGKIIKGTEIDVELTAIASAVSSKADTASPTFSGTPLGPTASAGTNTTQLATTAFVTAAVAASFPSGGIILWSGSVAAIPTGWVLCNGSNSTPDLRDRFIIGAGSTYVVGATGGSTSVTPAGTISVTGTALTEAQMPKHFHSLRGPNGPFTSTVPSATASGGGNYGGGTPDDGTIAYGTNSTGGNSASGTAGTGTSNGDAHTHSATFTGTSGTVIPPYYALCYIMKT